MSAEPTHPAPNTMLARRVGVDTYQEPVVYMRDDCPVCRSEGFTAQTRLEITLGDRRVIATLNIVHGEWLSHCEAGLSESAWGALQAVDGAPLQVSHAPPLESLGLPRRTREYGKPARRTILDDAGNVVAEGIDVADEIKAVAVNSYRLVRGTLRCATGRPL